MVDRGAERNSALPVVFDQDFRPASRVCCESQQGDLDERGLIGIFFLSITALERRGLEEGTYTGSGGQLGGCRSICLGDAVSAEVESESCLLWAAGLSGTVGARCRTHEERGN